MRRFISKYLIPGIVVCLIFIFGSLGISNAANCGKDSRQELEQLSCGDRVSLVVSKVCATTTVKGKKTQMVAVELETRYPSTRGVETTLYESGDLSGSMKRLIREKGKEVKNGQPFVLFDKSYNSEGKGGFMKAWAVTDKKGSQIDQLNLQIQLGKGDKICKKEVVIGNLWGTKWWDDRNPEKEKY